MKGDRTSGPAKAVAGCRLFFFSTKTPASVGGLQRAFLRRFCGVSIKTPTNVPRKVEGFFPKSLCPMESTEGDKIMKKQNTNKKSSWKEKKPKKLSIQYDKHGIFIARHDGVAAAARAMNCSQGGLCSCLKGRRKSCAGFMWKYEKVSDVVIAI